MLLLKSEETANHIGCTYAISLLNRAKIPHILWMVLTWWRHFTTSTSSHLHVCSRVRHGPYPDPAKPTSFFIKIPRLTFMSIHVFATVLILTQLSPRYSLLRSIFILFFSLPWKTQALQLQCSVDVCVCACVSMYRCISPHFWWHLVPPQSYTL